MGIHRRRNLLLQHPLSAFHLQPTSSLPIDSMEQRTFVMDDGTLWLFPPHSGKVQQYSLNAFDADTLSTRLSVSTTEFHSKDIGDILSERHILFRRPRP